LRLKLIHFLAQGLARFGLSVGIRGANGLLENAKNCRATHQERF
jgi:hypothetical protein